MGTVNIQMLKGRIAENGLNIKLLAEKTGIERYAMYRKIKEAGRLMTVGDANKIAQVLNLSDTDKLNIFFSQNVA